MAPPADGPEAGAAFPGIVADSSTSLSKFDRDFKASTFNTSATTDRLRYIWAPPVAAGAESLELTVHRGAGAFAEMETAYMGRIDGKPAPMERLDSHTILNA